MRFQAIRHATCIIEYAGTTFVVDPILYDKNTLSPVKGGLDRNNPLVDLPLDKNILKKANAILLTHTHRDHFDPAILDYFGKDIAVICSTEYKRQLSDLGARNLHLIDESINFNKISITLTQGKHGTGPVGIMMGNSYGFVLKAEGEETLYITGDTVWCKCVEAVLETHLPRHIIAFAGSAVMNGTHITMNTDDILKVVENAPNAKVIIIHMEAWNHCGLSRADLRCAVPNENLLIPEDGEQYGD